MPLVPIGVLAAVGDAVMDSQEEKSIIELQARTAELELEVLHHTTIAAAELAVCVRNLRRGYVSGEGTANGHPVRQEHSDWSGTRHPIKKCIRCQKVALHYQDANRETSIYCINCRRRGLLHEQRRRYEAKFTRPRINGKRVRVLKEQRDVTNQI